MKDGFGPSIRARAVVLSGAAALISAVLLGTMLHSESAARTSIRRAEALQSSKVAADELLLAISQQQAALRGYMDTALPEFQQDYRRSQQSADAALSTLRSGLLPPGVDLDAVVRARRAWEGWAASRQGVVEARASPVVDPAASVEGERRFDTLRTAGDRLSMTLRRATSSAIVESSALSRDVTMVMVASAVMVGAGIVLISALFWRWTLRPMMRLARSAAALASAKEVTIPPSTRRDEVGALTNALALLQRTLAERDVMFRMSPDPQVVSNFDGFMTDVNSSMEALSGYTRAELLARPSLDFVHPDDHEASARAEAQAMEGASVALEMRLLCRDGSVRMTRWTGVRSPTRDLVYWIGRDVTKRVHAEEQLRVVAEEAHSANRAKSEFLSRMSHELRTPLNAVLGFAQLLEIRLDDRQRDLVRPITTAGRHLLNLINDVLDISRIESGQIQLSLEPVPVDAVIREAIELAAPLASARRVELEGEPHLLVRIHVTADAQRLKQVLLNLLSNAVKYNCDGGKVSVCVVTHDGRVRVGVSDTGPGIPEGMLDRLFQPFDRLGAEQSGVEGTGLGLAICRGLITAMGGTIWAESSGGGSTFWVELELARDPIADVVGVGNLARRPDSSPRAAGRGRSTVLYVEDNLSNLDLIRRILELRPRVDLVPAMQGRLALELVHAHHVDLVLLDLHLPDISGEQVLERLRADERTRRIPVVMISADATQRQIDRLLGAGALAYLTKPVDLPRFLAVLDEVLSTAGHLAEQAPGS